MSEDRRLGRHVALLVLLVLAVAGLARAVALAWVCDDAFISFRYADNLIHGHGLVYNVGERVEGYTNLLWTLLMAAAMKVGAPPIPASQALGILAYAALVLALAGWAWRRSRRSGRPFLPLAAGLALVLNDFQVWATGGLETMLFAFLGLQGLLLTRLDASQRRAALLAGVLFALGVLTRPDGLLFAAAGAASYWLPAGRLPLRTRIDRSLCVLGPVLIVLSVLIPVKLAYYGDVFPTAFYSKSVMLPYPSQGLFYVALYAAKNWFLIAGFAVALLAHRLGNRAERPPEMWDDLFFVGAATLFLAYLVHVGGDFMFARRMIPAAPLLLLVLEDLVDRLSPFRLRVALALLVLAAATLPLSVYRDGRLRVRGIADERRFYPARALETRRLQARAVGEALAGTDARVALAGGMCAFGYYSRLPYLVEMSGLTQYSLAKKPLVERGWIGHEKSADDEWLTENNIHLLISHQAPGLPPPAGSPRYDEIRFGDLVRGRIHLYSDAVMDVLRKREGVVFFPIEELIERSKRQVEVASPAEAERIYERLDRYYFRAAGERGREPARILREAIERKAQE